MKKLLQENRKFSENLLKYINDSPTAYHAVENAAKILKENEFQEIKETEPWVLEKGGKYFLTKNSSGIIAFVVGNSDLAKDGFRIIGAHTDSPNLKIKPGPCTVTDDGYVKLNVEVYGGAILSTWFDRPLSVAGRVVLKEDGMLKEKLIKIDRPLFVLPNLCIHFQRDVNDNCSYNKQKDIFPLICMKRDGFDKNNYLFNLLSVEAGVDKDKFFDYDLHLYEYQEGIFTGENEEFISASRIDNLSMVFAGMSGLIESASNHTKVFAAFDNEEVGSASAQGADSGILMNVLKRICKNLDMSDDQYFQAIANSTSISADTAHAVHPNYSEKHDPENRPVLGGGPTIKYSAAQRYGTTAVSASYFIDACKTAGVPYQKFVMRNDMTGGSTIGPTISKLTTIPTVDMGTAILAMHSVREFGSVADNIYTKKAFCSYYDMLLNL